MVEAAFRGPVDITRRGKREFVLLTAAPQCLAGAAPRARLALPSPLWGGIGWGLMRKAVGWVTRRPGRSRTIEETAPRVTQHLRHFISDLHPASLRSATLPLRGRDKSSVHASTRQGASRRL